ncbi:hypothetical protein Avbf_08080 [Armadillidium vulgare]|nr:hypothetical protein Avbf_08080 [Armadillidium vulgare]
MDKGKVSKGWKCVKSLKASNEPLCPFCGKKFNAEERIPKELKCGHTICLTCLFGSFENSQKCPRCSVAVKERVSKVATNFDLLRMISEISEAASEPPQMKRKTIKNLVEIRMQRMKRNSKILCQLNDKLITCVESLKQCTGNETEEELERWVQKMEEQIWNIDFLSYSYCKPDLKSDFNFADFPSTGEFFFQIVSQLYERKNVYAFKMEWYNKEIYFGKLTYDCEKGRLLIHCFTTKHPPFPSFLVSLNDLKMCMDVHEFRTFLIIEDQFFLCTMLTSSVKSLNFIRLCSGEDGTSFKGLCAKIFTLPSLEDVIDIKVEMPKPRILDDYGFLEVLLERSLVDMDEKLRVRMYEAKCEFVKMPSSPCSESSYGGVENFDDVIACAETSGLVFVYSYIKSMGIVNNCGLCFEFPIRRRMKFSRMLGHYSNVN